MIKGGRSVNNIQVSENFHLSEFQCRCCGQVKLDSELLNRLQAIRTQTGMPMRINSGYRCPAHNRRVGGASNSQHMTGKAADIVIMGMPMAQQRRICDQHFNDGGIGIANTFTHVDTRGTRVRWNY